MMVYKRLTLLFATAMAAAAVLSAASTSHAASREAKKIVFVHGEASHGYGGHAYGAAFRMLAEILNEKVPEVTAPAAAATEPPAASSMITRQNMKTHSPTIHEP